MSDVGLLTDEHVPGPCVAVLRSIDYDVLRAKDEFPEGTADGVLLEFTTETDRIVVTCDKRFTVVDGELITDHAGVIYADQSQLQRRPEDAAASIDRYDDPDRSPTRCGGLPDAVAIGDAPLLPRRENPALQPLGTTGSVDAPDANVAVVLSGSGSEREFVQRLGRALVYEAVTRDTAEERTAERRR